MSKHGENLIEKYDARMRSDKKSSDGTLHWHCPLDEPFHIAGLAWLEEERIYRRLPTNPAYPIPEAVDYLANHTAGSQIRFQTNSRHLSVKVKLAEKANMTHMPPTGQCGIDCYIGAPGEMRFCNVTKYPVEQSEYECALFSEFEPQMRNITLNLPLYMGVREVWIGLEENAQIVAPPSYASNQKVIVYGTSITQGGCATRPGMAYTNILSRQIPVEFINLGFSGSGRGEPEMAHLIADIPDPALLVLDYEANCQTTELFSKTLPEFVRILRDKHAEVPILIVSKINYSRNTFDKALQQAFLDRKEIQRECVRTHRKNGDRSIYFFDGSTLLGGEDFHECTVDGSHPTDLGFLRMANGLAPVIRTILFP